jgi:hypothetical protein
MKDTSNYAGLWYASGDATITGSYTDDDGTNTFNCTLKAGWNYVFSSLSGSTLTMTASKTLPSDYKWQVSNTIPHL